MDREKIVAEKREVLRFGPFGKSYGNPTDFTLSFFKCNCLFIIFMSVCMKVVFLKKEFINILFIRIYVCLVFYKIYF